MSDEAGFLKAIAELRAERSTRLVYADWLDEHDRPRDAEFLRLQLQIAELSARLIELGGQLDATWLTAVAFPGNSNTLTLRSGRTIHLREIRQSLVYEGLLEGLPTHEMNQRHIASARTRDQGGGGAASYVIEPPERPIQYDRDRPYPFGTPAAIPGVECVGRFGSSRPARDTSRDGSALTIIWFQDSFAFPIEPGVREQIRAIDWDQHAHDYSW